MGIKPFGAFILAAGFGTRLRPYTDHCPKPMVEVAGRSLIWRTLDKLRAAGVCDVVVNTHYMADILAQHMADYMAMYADVRIQISHEDEILDTGGGVKNALSYFRDDQPFYVIAGDALWDVLDDGRAVRSLDKTGTHMWTNIRLNAPSIYKDAEDGAFSFLPIMDGCEARGRLQAIEYVGDWHHISTPQDLERAGAHFRSGGA